jgi:hypothetical protein
MLLGEVAERMDPTSLFARAMRGEEVSDAVVDGWIEAAARSVDRLRQWLGDAGGFSGDPSAMRPTLTAEDFKLAFALALARHGLRLQETRNSANRFVPGVYHFPLPEAFRDPVFRPSRTCHVVFDREVFPQVRDEDLGTVRGQPIKPVLAGFGEPVTDWLFQSALEARAGESAFCLHAGKDWPHGEGWLLVYSLRWLGTARRLAAPDSVAAVFSGSDGPVLLKEADLVWLTAQSEPFGAATTNLPLPDLDAARRLAQRRLRELVERREPAARSSAGMSLWLAAAVENVPGSPPSKATETAAKL